MRAPCSRLALLLLALLAASRPSTGQAPPPATAAAPPARAPLADPGPGELLPGTETVDTGAGLLAALQDGVGTIVLSQDIALTPAELSALDGPITLLNSTLIRSNDDSGMGTRPRKIDWGGALELIEVPPGATLTLDNIISAWPGNFTLGEETLPLKNNGSSLWPTVVLQPGAALRLANTLTYVDDPACSAENTQVAVQRLSKMFPGIQYLGGVRTYFPSLVYPLPAYDLRAGASAGRGLYSLQSATQDCFNSLKGERYPTAEAPPSSDGGGTPSWVWAVVGSVLGCAALAAVAGAFLWRRSRRRAAAAAAAGKHGEDGLVHQTPFASAKQTPGSTGDLAHMGHVQGSSSDLPWSSQGGGPDSLSGPQRQSIGGSGGDLQSQMLRTRFGPIDGVTLGELLGRGAFGRVYKGRWRGALVAVKVVDHRVQQGQVVDLSREPLLSMSVSHPHVVQTHKICVCRLSIGDSEDASAAAAVEGGTGGSGSDSGKPVSSGSGGAKVPAPDGSHTVQVVEPNEVLQPGHYETWLITEYCDRGSLSELLRGRPGAAPTQRWAPDPAMKDVWTLLTLLDIAQGLDYLHHSNIIHGDLKPANVLLKGARNDRRGFVAKLGDFGLSRFIGTEATHVETQSYGTASYAAPELLFEGKLSAAADIYSLGIIMWEVAAAGTELYPGMTTMQVILQVTTYGMRPEPPADCPAGLEDLMRRCWSKDPAARPTTDAVVEELRALLTVRARTMSGGSGQLPSRQASGSNSAAPVAPPSRVESVPAAASPFAEAAQAPSRSSLDGPSGAPPA